MDLIRNSCEWLESKRNTLLSNQVTYTRGVTSSVLNATFAETAFQEIDSNGVMIDTRMKDFIFVASEFEAIFGKPQAGDRIEYTEGTEDLVFEAQASQGAPVYENDSYRLSIIVHTQLIDE